MKVLRSLPALVVFSSLLGITPSCSDSPPGDTPDPLLPGPKREPIPAPAPPIPPDLRCADGEIACRGRCCPEGVDCVDGLCEYPDLVVDEESLVQSIRFDQAIFPEDDCAMEESCVAGPGLRRLLRFTLAANNIGGADLYIGDPDTSPYRYWSECHQHFHMVDFATYRLIDGQGGIVAEGHKQAFCFRDTDRIGPQGPAQPQYDCDVDQGISRGWSDSYASDLDCQWVDITGVEPGDYFLEVIVNESGIYPELDYTNNRVVVPVEVPPDPSVCIPREEICGDGIDQSCAGEPDSGCPPITGIGTCGSVYDIRGSGVWTAVLQESDGAPPASCGGEGASLYFRFEILRDELVYISTHGSEVDTVLSITEGDACGGAELACEKGSCGTGQSHFVGQLAYGKYILRVQANSADATGRVRLEMQRSRCQNARHISGPGVYTGRTSGEGQTMTSCGVGRGPEELWYFVTCPGTTRVEIDTCGQTDFNTVLELRRESCRGEPVACNDDAQPTCSPITASSLRHDIDRPGLWFLLVDGYGRDSGGSYELNVTW